MFKLWATIIKDIRILTRDKVGILLMFGMPILLVIIVTSIQNSTFQLIDKNKISLLIANRDTGRVSKEFIQSIDKIGMFKLVPLPKNESNATVMARMKGKDALLAIIIPNNFSVKMEGKAKIIADKALNTFGLESNKTDPNAGDVGPITLYYQPILQESFRRSVQGAIYSALQLIESKLILKNLYFSINEKPLPARLENELLDNKITINEIPVSKSGSHSNPNASQHNVPAWTLFAMFFVVISLGGSMVREKLSGSFIRLKTLPTNYMVTLISKQITYLAVTMLQAAVIFAIGIWLFPLIHLPALNLPVDVFGLVIVSLICGWCAVSYAICIGVFAHTPEQANGFGAVSIVILAAIGGLMVPSFAMPQSFALVMKLSPMHWCLEAYYGLFLEGGTLNDVLINIIPLLLITICLQALSIAGLKMKNLI
ncbi:ABC-2 type transport system permease protein [Mucilaginibacter sp. UYP25]|uniref:ABC transporter permease n=1 Tax=unclassified Mucilaginibacter TaxID=2617802 RepID=UPI003393ACC2